MSDRADRPSAFLVGAPKSGSSALANFLAQHPQVAVPSVKETNYFCRDLDMPRPRDEAEYLGLFETGPETRVLLDPSILAMYSREAADAIAAECPDARILAVLRNPVEVMESWHAQMSFTANEPISEFPAALDAESERKEGRSRPTVGASARCPELLYYRDVVRFGEQLERYVERFGADRVHVVLNEDLRADPDRVYGEILEFLELDAFTPEFAEVNAARERRSWRLHYWAKRLFAPAARALLPLDLRLRLIQMLDTWNSKPTQRAKLDAELAERLREDCRADVERLSRLLGRDLSHWVDAPEASSGSA